MKCKILQCADRPRIERHGKAINIKFDDAGFSETSVEMNMSQARAMAQEIMEMINEYKEETNVNPMFKDILDRIEGSGGK